MYMYHGENYLNFVEFILPRAHWLQLKITQRFLNDQRTVLSVIHVVLTKTRVKTRLHLENFEHNRYLNRELQSVTGFRVLTIHRQYQYSVLTCKVYLYDTKHWDKGEVHQTFPHFCTDGYHFQQYFSYIVAVSFIGG